MVGKQSKMVKKVPATGNLPQNGQIPAIFRFLDGKTGKKKAAAALRIASSEHERAIGLSQTEKLGEASGMFFTKAGTFWMPPEMKFPLDIVFLDRNGTILEKKAMKMDRGRGRYTSYEPGVAHAIELPLGFCDKHGVKPGDTVSLVTYRHAEKTAAAQDYVNAGLVGAGIGTIIATARQLALKKHQRTWVKSLLLSALAGSVGAMGGQAVFDGAQIGARKLFSPIISAAVRKTVQSHTQE